jgi:uncharacterized membrane protein YhaH (DUF805 family)
MLPGPYSLAVASEHWGCSQWLHDLGHSGCWLFIGLIPFIGIIMLLILLVSDSHVGTNQYGLSPKLVE